MPLTVVAGPAGAGKTDAIAANAGDLDVVIDFTLLFNALYPQMAGRLREGDKLPSALAMTAWVKQAAVRHAYERNLPGFVTTTRPDQIDSLLAATGGNRDADLIIVDPGRDEVLRRLRESQGEGRMDECERAVERWYAGI